MGIGKRIKEARERAGLTQEELGNLVGVTGSAITNYEKETSHPKEPVMYALIDTLNVDANYLFQDCVKIKKSPPYSSEAMKLAKDYDNLDKWGKTLVRDTTDHELARMEDEARFFDSLPVEPEEKAPKVIPLYLFPAAAGYAAPAFGSDFIDLELRPEDPQGAEFAVRIQGDSMEPAFTDGSKVFCNHDPLSDGDVGIFSVDGGEIVCKQYHYDPALGITYLFSINRARADADVIVTRDSGRNLMCFGRVMVKGRYPLPHELG